MEAFVRSLLRSSLAAFFFIVLTLGAYVCTRYLDSSVALMDRNSPQESTLTTETAHNFMVEPTQNYIINPNTIAIPLNCSLGNQTLTCPANYYPSNYLADGNHHRQSTPPYSCPDYFRWIHGDLWPWRETGITEEMMMQAKEKADFRLVILNGRAYIEKYRTPYQTRDVFTQWGILQLLRRYPGKIPDLDLMFDCSDLPVLRKENYKEPDFPAPPPLFRYCSNEKMFEIVFPDWSFWGWPEINAKPWEGLSKDIQEGNKMSQWKDRERHAYWKGNPTVAMLRMDLLKCNVSDKHDYNARLYVQNWRKERKRRLQALKLSNPVQSQVEKGYKIYIEGASWSVSEKYILACDSMTLFVKPRYHDFFTRSLVPLKHYWPIKFDDKCRSIKHAVDWGNTHPEKAEAIGKAGSSFIQEELKMDNVYDYMFHLLSEYAKLLKYKPTVPSGAVEVCSESMACPAQGLVKEYLIESMAKGPALSEPCTMPPPYSPASLHSVIERQNNGIEQVDTWEKQYWEWQSLNKQT